MTTGLFDSVKGNMIHYFVRPNDSFILNSLEKLDADEYLYRLLRNEGYERIFFIDIDETHCSAWTYDQLSAYAFLEPKKTADLKEKNKDNLAAFYEQPERNNAPNASGATGLNLKYVETPAVAPTKKHAPGTGKQRLQVFATQDEFEGFMTSRISPALHSRNLKAAVVVPIELFDHGGFITSIAVDTIRKAQRENSSKSNIIVVSAPRREDLLKCMNVGSIHYWTAAISARGVSGEQLLGAVIEVLQREGILVLADKISDDEIANLLLRKKLVEKDQKYAHLSYSKVYGIAELLGAHCRMEKSHFETIPQFQMHDFIRQLDRRLCDSEVAAEVLAKAEGLHSRTLCLKQNTAAVMLSRVTGIETTHYQKSEEEAKSDYSAAMANLNDLIGLEAAKEKLQLQLNNALVYGAEDGPGHYFFVGNPGTGKTEVARLVGDILKSAGLLRKGHCVECRAADLISEHVGGSSIKTRKKCEEALDGVLFLDEAYELVNTESTGDKFPSDFAKDAYTELMAFMENNRKRICMIFAGYPDKMVFFRNANPGMAQRVSDDRIISFPDYSAKELLNIFRRFARKDSAAFQLSDGFVVELEKAISIMVSAKTEDFANAREMRVLFSLCKQNAAQRYVQSHDEALRHTFVAEDIPNVYRQVSSPENFEKAMEKLDDLIGLEAVKEKLHRQMNTSLAYGATDGPGHYFFVGNPGTGKTEVARLVGEILKGAGLLRKGHCVECRKADLVADHNGATAGKTRKKCEEALDGVLFFDEAYELVNTESTGGKFKDSYDEEAFTELMTFMEKYRRRICMIFAGYPDKMTFFRNANPGMAQRISDSRIIPFPDYSADELVDIFKRFARKDPAQFQVSEALEMELKKVVSSMVRTKTDDFSNAREMRNLFEGCKECAAQRYHLTSNAELKTMLMPEDIPESYRWYAPGSTKDALDALNALVGLVPVKAQVAAIANRIRYPADSTARANPGNYLFSGNPGTGKTEVARLMGPILHSVGVLSKGHVVEVSAADLIVGYVGASGNNTQEYCKRALGGVLFVDEAYALISSNSAGHDFGQSAVETIMKFMEDHKENICVIFAGYQKDLEQLFKMNQGMSSRFADTILFPDYSMEELKQILYYMADKRGFELSDEFVSAAMDKLQWRKLTQGASFGNAREVRSLLDAADGFRANRIAAAIQGGTDQDSIQMNLLTGDDIGAHKANTQESVNTLNAMIPTSSIASLPTLCSDDRLNDAVCLAEATDSAVLFVKTESGSGTAFLISPEGYALTCNHVIEKAQEVKARLRVAGPAGAMDFWLDCKVINAIKDLDLALIKLDGANYPYLSLAPEDRIIRKGEQFILSGYPLGERTAKDLTTYPGSIASSDNQTDEHGYTRYLIGGEAKSGNSGSPIIALSDGRVIGVLLGSLTERTSEILTEEINYMRPIKYFWQEFTK